MKFLFTCFLLFVITFSFSQSSFQTRVSVLSGVSFSDITQLRDSSFIGVGYFNRGDTFSGIAMAKLDPKGHLAGLPVLMGSQQQLRREAFITATTDSGFVVSATLNDTVHIMKFDWNMNVQWNKALTHVYTSASRVALTADSGFLVAANGPADAPTGGTCFLVKLDAAGNVVSTRNYLSAQTSLFITDVAIAADGGYVFAAQSQDVFFHDLGEILVAKTDSTGSQVVWSKQIRLDQSVFLGIHNPLALLSAADGSVVVTGVVYPIAGSHVFVAQGTLSKFDKEGNYLWTKESNYQDTGNIYALGLAENAAHNGYLVSGGILNSDPDQLATGFILRTDSNGVQLSSQAYGVDGVATYFQGGLVTTLDGGFAAAGFDNNDSTGQISAILYKFNTANKTCTDGTEEGNISNTITTAHNVSLIIRDTVKLTAEEASMAFQSAGKATNICSEILPVRLLSFTAALQANNKVAIEWKTANEVNADHFVVQRSSNAASFTNWQTVPAAGNSGVIKTYTTTDNLPLGGISYYRLQERDMDGRITYSSTVQVTISSNGTITIVPNPVGNSINVHWQNNLAGRASLQVTNLSGQVLVAQQVVLVQGMNTVSIPSASLAKGIYVLKVMQSSGALQSVKFIKE